jgi:heat shock protein HslJ
MSMFRLAALAAPLLLLVAACGDDTIAPGAEAPDQLDGRTFVGADVSGHALVKGTTLRFDFKDGNVGVTAGCNHLSGPATLTDGALQVGSMGGTEMGCDQALMDQDTWLAGFLESGPAATVDDQRLVLAKGGTTIAVEDEAQMQAGNPIDLEGTTWQLESVLSGPGDEGTATSVPAGVTPTLLIADGTIQLFTGCNRGMGSVEVTESTLTVPALALTKMACSQELAALESAFTIVLGGQTGYAQAYDVLTLTSPDGASGLQFRASSR